MFKTPILRSLKPIDATVLQAFNFLYDGQNQAVRNNLIIETLDGTVIYNQTQNTFALSHSLPANTLVNGNSYRAKVRVGDVNNNWTSFSEFLIFHTLAKPVILVTSIDEHGKVYNQTINFEATYAHPNNEPLQSYRYYLYDNNQTLITAFPEKFADGSLPITQEITGLVNGDLYHVQIGITTPKGQEEYSEMFPFTPFYISPFIAGVLRADNVEEQGAVKVNISARQVMFKLYDINDTEIPFENIEYVDGEKIDLNRVDYKRISSNSEDGFGIDRENFYCQLWVGNVIENEVIFKLYSPNGWLELKYYGNKFHVFKYYYNNSIVAHFASNEVLLGGQMNVGLRQFNGLVDVFAKVVE